jgi:hypothetical protein
MRLWIEQQRGMFDEPWFVVCRGNRRLTYHGTRERAERAIRLMVYLWHTKTDLGRAAARRLA